MLVHVTKYIYEQPPYKEADAYTAKVEAVACRTLKINLVFIAAVVVDVPKYIYGQNLYEEADACIAKWKLWRARL